MNLEMMRSAKTDLKQMYIDELGEMAYQREIQDRVKFLSSFKITGDKLFGRDDKMFRDTVIEETIKKYKEYDQETQLFEMVMTDIALDVFSERS